MTSPSRKRFPEYDYFAQQLQLYDSTMRADSEGGRTYITTRAGSPSYCALKTLQSTTKAYLNESKAIGRVFHMYYY